MKLQQMALFHDEHEIIEHLKTIGITQGFTINHDGSVDVPQTNVTYMSKPFDTIPIKYNRVLGFFVSSVPITTLENCPEVVERDFVVQTNALLTTMKGGPSKVGGNYHISHTSLQTLEHAPLEVGGNFYIGYTNVKDFHNIHKTAFRNITLGGSLVLGPDVRNIVGLAAIPGITHIIIPLRHGKSASFNVSHNDVIQFQEQLIDAGFSEKAKL